MKTLADIINEAHEPGTKAHANLAQAENLALDRHLRSLLRASADTIEQALTHINNADSRHRAVSKRTLTS
jgi:hypothetical protein